LKRYVPTYSTTVVLPEGTKPYSLFYGPKIKKLVNEQPVDFVVDTSLGPVPLALDEMYPLAQSVFPDHADRESAEISQEIMKKFLAKKKVVRWKQSGFQFKKNNTRKKMVDPDVQRVSAVADMQFGKGASRALLKGSIKIIKSKHTGKIRNIFLDGTHVLSMRAEDGLFTLKIDGARRLHHHVHSPRLRVVIKEDAVPFVREGKSVFAKFVLECDPDLRPFDECLIVDKHDALHAVGRTLLTRAEMRSFQYGMAVKTRETILKKQDE